MKLYKKERNNDLLLVLSLVIKDDTGVCTNTRIQRGTYDINGSHITLYSFWDRRGNVHNAPYGARVQHYDILDDQTVVKKSSYIYIESESKSYNEEIGMQYLFTDAKTDREKDLFAKYISEMERKYKGKFLFGNEAEKLLKEVQNALIKQTRKRWKETL